MLDYDSQKEHLIFKSKIIFFSVYSLDLTVRATEFKFYVGRNYVCNFRQSIAHGCINTNPVLWE